jgi:hypothetical protein
VSILGALLCFPNHHGELTVLEPNQGELSLMLCNDAKVSKLSGDFNILLQYILDNAP